MDRDKIFREAFRQINERNVNQKLRNFDKFHTKILIIAFILLGFGLLELIILLKILYLKML